MSAARYPEQAVSGLPDVPLDVHNFRRNRAASMQRTRKLTTRRGQSASRHSRAAPDRSWPTNFGTAVAGARSCGPGDRTATVTDRPSGTVDAMQMPERKMRARPATNAIASKKSAFRPGTLIRVADVCELLGVSVSTVYRWRSQEAFPEPVKLGPNTVRFRIDEIEAWRDMLGR
jgi:excisionase family DNA binding protein